MDDTEAEAVRASRARARRPRPGPAYFLRAAGALRLKGDLAGAWWCAEHAREGRLNTEADRARMRAALAQYGVTYTRGLP